MIPSSHFIVLKIASGICVGLLWDFVIWSRFLLFKKSLCDRFRGGKSIHFPFSAIYYYFFYQNVPKKPNNNRKTNKLQQNNTYIIIISSVNKKEKRIDSIARQMRKFQCCFIFFSLHGLYKTSFI